MTDTASIATMQDRSFRISGLKIRNLLYAIVHNRNTHSKSVTYLNALGPWSKSITKPKVNGSAISAIHTHSDCRRFGILIFKVLFIDKSPAFLSKTTYHWLHFSP